MPGIVAQATNNMHYWLYELEMYVWGLFCMLIYRLLPPVMQLREKQTSKQKGVHASEPRRCVMIVFAGVLHWRDCSSRSASPTKKAFGTVGTVAVDQRCSFMKREGQNLVWARVCVLPPVGGVRARRATARRFGMFFFFFSQPLFHPAGCMHYCHHIDRDDSEL